MPLTAKGEKIEAEMEREYGKDKGDKVFYASRNAGKLSGVDSAAHDADTAAMLKVALSAWRDGHDGKWIKQELKNQFKNPTDNVLEAVLMRSKREAGRADAEPVANRLDSLTNQLNTLGQGAKKIAERMDAGTNTWKVAVTCGGRRAEYEVFAQDKASAERAAKDLARDEYPHLDRKDWHAVETRKIS